MTSADDKRKIVLSILNCYAKEGASIKQINSELANDSVYFLSQIFQLVDSFQFPVADFEEIEGVKLAPTKLQAEEYMKTLQDVYLDGNGLYWSHSEKSKHIVKMVQEQKVKPPNNRREQNLQRFNKSYQHHRQTIS